LNIIVVISGMWSLIMFAVGSLFTSMMQHLHPLLTSGKSICSLLNIYIYIYIYRHICVFKNILLEHNKNVLTYDVLYNRLYKIIYHNVDSSSSK
jgi:hypothetical protein